MYMYIHTYIYVYTCVYIYMCVPGRHRAIEVKMAGAPWKWQDWPMFWSPSSTASPVVPCASTGWFYICIYIFMYICASPVLPCASGVSPFKHFP